MLTSSLSLFSEFFGRDIDLVPDEEAEYADKNEAPDGEWETESIESGVADAGKENTEGFGGDAVDSDDGDKKPKAKPRRELAGLGGNAVYHTPPGRGRAFKNTRSVHKNTPAAFVVKPLPDEEID